MRRCLLHRFQTGVHIPHDVTYHAAKMKHWPEQKIPKNFAFTGEQRFKATAMPRDTGKIPRDFLLSVLYRHQPCEISSLWEYCVGDPQTVLDSKRHLRSVLEQARNEGFVTFEMDAVTRRWLCHLTRERYEQVRAIVSAKIEATGQYSGLRGVAATETSEYATNFQAMNEEAKKAHLRILSEHVAETTKHLNKFQRTEIDYLPYTDLNGKVNFMWWYETADRRGALPAGSNAGDAQLSE